MFLHLEEEKHFGHEQLLRTELGGSLEKHGATTPFIMDNIKKYESFACLKTRLQSLDLAIIFAPLAFSVRRSPFLCQCCAL
ncbi:uncharacterized protein ARMOST_13627 [Armillaria ostoyae]|uniref:Uncharacterized protein n=1 Tax=Armillaria ostoyae TaxID=47428 RepID=A0A284RN95_ARMOS|nr:uncharacterized protein ARMOST_13627 [Armillaria ostoyae]